MQLASTSPHKDLFDGAILEGIKGLWTREVCKDTLHLHPEDNSHSD